MEFWFLLRGRLMVKKINFKTQLIFSSVLFALFYFIGSNKFNVSDGFKTILLYLFLNVLVEVVKLDFILLPSASKPNYQKKLKSLKTRTEAFRLINSGAILIAMGILLFFIAYNIFQFFKGVVYENVNIFYNLLLAISFAVYYRNVLIKLSDETIQKIDDELKSLA